MKAHLAVGIAALVFVASIGMAVTAAQSPSGDESRIKTGFAFAESQGISLNLAGQNRANVGLGSYLVNAVGGCNDCHTAPPYTQNPYAFLDAPKQVNVGCYLAGGQTFGPFVSRDITPTANGRPAGLTLDEFRHVLRTGEDPDNPGHVLQVMPWPVYQTMTDHDIEAIYDYLSTIPSIPVNACGVPSE